MSTLDKKRSKNITDRKNTSHTLPKGLYRLNLMPPPPRLSLKYAFLVILMLFITFFGQA
ncbi:MAG: hypothetical protein GDA51_05835, partial [Ekhidna sp.]|nr:hypothetical protein [Ekhidna sp.]